MKTLVLLLSLLSPLSSQAAELVCKTEGLGGPIQLQIKSEGAIDQPNAKVLFIAQGILLTQFQTNVDEVLAENSDQLLAVRVTTLDQNGLVTEDSGIAELKLALENVNEGEMKIAAGTGSILFLKLPKVQSPVRLLTRYELTECKGFLN